MRVGRVFGFFGKEFAEVLLLVSQRAAFSNPSLPLGRILNVLPVVFLGFDKAIDTISFCFFVVWLLCRHGVIILSFLSLVNA